MVLERQFPDDFGVRWTFILANGNCELGGWRPKYTELYFQFTGFQHERLR